MVGVGLNLLAVVMDARDFRFLPCTSFRLFSKLCALVSILHRESLSCISVSCNPVLLHCSSIDAMSGV